MSALKPETAEIVVSADKGQDVVLSVSASTVAQRIRPGERDLRNAASIAPSEVSLGDRVLVTVQPGTAELRRIVVMSASDITRRDEADRQDWIKRGVSGIVRERKGDTIVLAAKGPEGERTLTITATAKTSFRRYVPDSVRFADAKIGSIDEIRTGDQVRARGVTSADGSAVTAEEIVFGTFQTRVGSVVSIDAANRRLEIKEQGSAKTLLVTLSPATQIKGLPDFGAPGTSPPNAMSGPPDVAQMIETMPAASLDAVKQGQTVIVSSTKGAKPDELTAITMVINADMLLRIAAAFSGRTGAGRDAGQSVDAGGAGMNLGGMGFDLSGITP